MNLLLIIPCYNEQGNIKAVIQKLEEEYPEHDYIVINDGSKDDTEKILVENNINHITLKINCGLTAAFRAGVSYAQNCGKHYDVIGQFDADGQHLPEYIQLMLDKMSEENADIVIGSRFLKRKVRESFLKKICRKIISWVMYLLTGEKITDPTSGMRLYKDTVWKCFLKDDNLAPEPDTVVYFIKNGFRVREVDVEMNERMTGESYLTISKSIKYVIMVISSMIFIQWWRK